MPTPEETRPAPFRFVLVKPRVNRRKIEALEDLGIPVVERSGERQLDIKAEHAAKRGGRHYVRLGERVNATGENVGDSGIARISFNKHSPKDDITADASKAMTLSHIMGDLMMVGYRLADVHIVRRPGEKRGMGALVLVMMISEEGNHMPMSSDLAEVIDGFLDDYYRSVYVWDNPDGTATVNANTVVNADTGLSKVTDKRTLRFAFDGEKVRWQSSKAVDADQFSSLEDVATTEAPASA